MTGDDNSTHHFFRFLRSVQYSLNLEIRLKSNEKDELLILIHV